MDTLKFVIRAALVSKSVPHPWQRHNRRRLIDNTRCSPRLLHTENPHVASKSPACYKTRYLGADAKVAQLETISGRVYTNKLLAAEILQTNGGDGHAAGAVFIQGQYQAIQKKQTHIAVLGNSAMATVLCKKWFNHRDAQEKRLSKGDWDSLRQILNNSNLAKVGFAHGIDALIIMNSGCPAASNEIVATTVEAICGAAFNDALGIGNNGLDVVRRVMERLGLLNSPLLT